MQFELIDSGWDRILDDAVAADHSEIRVISPFIRKRAAMRLLKAGAPRVLRVITRFNLRDFCDGVNDTAALRWLMESGAQIRGVRGLHSKVYLFGQSRAIVTSANLTEAALLQNHEFGFVASDAAVVARCREYFDNLWDQAGDDLTLDRLNQWNMILDATRISGSRPAQLISLPDEGVHVGITVPLTVASPPMVSEAPQAFVKFFGEGHNRRNWGDSVLEAVTGSGCHWSCTYPKNRRPRQVEDGAVMYMGRLVKKPNGTLIFGRAIAMRYQEGRDDATEADKQLREWRSKWPHYIRVHHAEFVAGSLENGVPLSQLMDELKSDAFATTKRNAAKGRGNTDPRASCKQQPAVRLSNEGFAWLNDKLEAAFQLHGTLSPSVMEQLDWPQIPSTW